MEASKNLDNLRHSAAHLLAAAIMQLYPKAKRTIGPAIENGFYFDFDFGDIKVSESDFPKIEAKMREILPTWKEFQHHELSAEQAKKEYPGNEYKHELIEEFTKDGQKVSFYKSGEYWDLCKGGHCAHPNNALKHFKLLSVAGAYWRGNEKNKMLTRIYGTCFPNKTGLDEYLERLEEAKRRDHRKLGKELDLFSISQLTGPGLILWHPKLATVRNIVEMVWKEEHVKNGYQLVYTPHIASMDMFVKSRHYSKYANAMFPPMFHEYIQGESRPDYATDEQLKPMNCPNHIQIFNVRPRSYREMPIRLGELGTVYRFERAGVLHGLTRVRGFTQDDSHLFCRPDQVIAEVKGILRLTKQLYELFGFKEFVAYLATRPEKYLGDLKTWEFAENSLKQALEEEKVNYVLDPGEGAFYGPKIDSKIKDSIGREWQLGTIQFDFNMPDRAETTSEEVEDFWQYKIFKDKFKTKENLAQYLKKMGRGFDVSYIDDHGQEKRAFMIHRTILGSMERFFGILIEHYGGKFPLWLAPVQMTLVPIAERHLEYAREVAEKMKAAGIRVEIDERSESMQAKVRDATLQKVPQIGIIGDKEVAAQSLSVRHRDGSQENGVATASVVAQILKHIERKTIS